MRYGVTVEIKLDSLTLTEIPAGTRINGIGDRLSVNVGGYNGPLPRRQYAKRSSAGFIQTPASGVGSPHHLGAKLPIPRLVHVGPVVRTGSGRMPRIHSRGYEER